MTVYFKLQDIPVTKSDYTFKIEGNSGYEERLVIANYKTFQLGRVITYFKLQETPVLKSDFTVQIIGYLGPEERIAVHIMYQ